MAMNSVNMYISVNSELHRNKEVIDNWPFFNKTFVNDSFEMTHMNCFRLL